MKRSGKGQPGVIVHRWNRPPLSCLPCRQKKRRCDRCQPCSNCRQRNALCEYATGDATRPDENGLVVDHRLNTGQIAPGANGEDALSRIQRLEDAVFANDQNIYNADSQSRQAHGSAAPGLPWLATPTQAAPHVITTPFGISLFPPEPPLHTPSVLAQLPPRHQATELCGYFTENVQQTIAIFHMPSTRALIEKAYDTIGRGGKPGLEDTLTLFVVFAGAAHACTPDMLQRLNTTEDGARDAFEAYTRPAMQIVSNPALSPTTTCLAAMATLLHLLISADGIPMSVHLLRSRLLLMVRTVQLHKLDAAPSPEDVDMVEAEVRRRVWWDLVSTDWLSSFSGNPFEGAYIFHPRHMAVNYPGNIDDEDLTPTTKECDLNAPLDTPTGMSAFLQRVKLAGLCREAVDTLPSMLLEREEADYSSILALGSKFQAYLHDLPPFFRLDPDSIRRSRALCIARPMIRHQRVAGNLGVHIRICRLHRPYYVRGRTDARYAPSRAACLASAQSVLDLRQEMDDYETKRTGPRPARLWKVAQHVFFAALILAADVALDPTAVDAQVKRQEVLKACRTLEESMKESATSREGAQSNLQTLMKTLRGDGVGTSSHSATTNTGDETGTSTDPTLEGLDWDAWWAEFLAVAPDLDVQGWDTLLGNFDLGLPEYGG